MSKRIVIAGVVGLMVLTPLGAQADRGLYSWQGGDYSYDYSKSYKIQIHDGEADDHPVRVEYRMTRTGVIRHLYNDGGVNTNKYESLSTFPRAHRAVEILNNRPDAYGVWKFPE